MENSDVMSTAGGIASISQIAGTACMSKCYYWVDAFLEHLKKNRDYAVDRLNQMPMIKAYRPHATYLLYVDIRAFGMKSEEFTDYMKEKVKLAVVSGGEKFSEVVLKVISVSALQQAMKFWKRTEPSGKRNRYADPGKKSGKVKD